MRLYLSIAVALSIVLLYSLPAFSQETTGNIEGVVVDGDGNPIADVAVSVADPGQTLVTGTRTSSDGYFTIYRLPVGTFAVVLSRFGL